MTSHCGHRESQGACVLPGLHTLQLAHCTASAHTWCLGLYVGLHASQRTPGIFPDHLSHVNWVGNRGTAAALLGAMLLDLLVDFQ
jgi:hypothetical protein